MLLVAIATGPALFSLGRAGVSAQSAKQAVTRMQTRMEARDFQGASRELDTAYTSLLTMKDALRGVGFWRDVPGIGTQIRALEDAASAGAETLDGVRGIVAVAAQILDIASHAEALTGELGAGVDTSKSFEALTAQEKRSILSRLDAALPDMRAAQAKIDIALQTYERIPQNELVAPLRTALAPVTELLPKLKRTLDEAVPLLEVMIPLAGYPEPAEYLILLQNTDEIRPTGGFIGTVGKLTIDGGDIQRFEFDDVYNIDNPASGSWKEPAPEPMTTWLRVPTLFFRDANWSPDFPTSAETLLDFYVREVEIGTGARPQAPNIVLALNPPLFRELLRIVGPITIENFTFTADDYFDILEYQVEVGFLEQGIPRTQRKALISKLGDELMARLLKLPVSRWPELLDLLTRSLDQKQVIVYARDPHTLSRLDQLGWTGRALPARGDFIWIVDANLAALKTDGVMDKRAEYSLDATDPNNPIATLRLRYTNNAPGFTEYRYTRYRSYTRVYVPDGAELLSSNGAMKNDRVFGGRVDVVRELGKTVFGAFWSIEPGRTQDLVFTYRLPASVGRQIQEGAYRLDWQKQPGNDTAEWTMDIAFGKPLRSASPPEDSEDHGDDRYRFETQSLTDRSIDVAF